MSRFPSFSLINLSFSAFFLSILNCSSLPTFSFMPEKNASRSLAVGAEFLLPPAIKTSIPCNKIERISLT